jgi:outer membrane protein OmpA-like peptidoglycan-associated protein
MKQKILIAILLFNACWLWGQSKGQYVKAADEAFEKGNYYAALTYYNEALEFEKNDTAVLFRSAESARLFDSYKLAIQKYTYLLDTLNYNNEPLVLFHLGDLHQKLGNYAKSKEYYDLYTTQYGNENDYYTNKAKVESIACEWALSKAGFIDSLVLVNRLKSDVNSVDSDFAPTIKGNKLVYSSMRYKEQKAKKKPSRQISKILIYSDGKSEVFDTKLNDTELALGNTAIASDSATIYFTKCYYVAENQLRCELFKGVIMDETTITDVEKMKILNDSSYTTTHPSIGKLEGDDREVLFFASDRKGGKGKLDIWFSYLDAKGPTQPKNLSAINTVEDDITPFYHQQSNTLFYSSTGKRGFGGFDVYAAVFNKDSVVDHYHPEPPTNSSYHDLYYVLSNDFKKGYLSSNREGALYVDNYLESCCFDIFELDIEELNINLRALTYNLRTGENLNGAIVTLIDKSTGKIVAKLSEKDTNLYIIPIERGKTYFLKAEKEGFKPDSTSFTTTDIRTSQDITKKLFLEPDLIKLDVFTFDDLTKEALNAATVVLEDLTDPTNPQIFRINELSNDFHFDLEKGKTYRIKATKDGYTAESELIDTRGLTGTIRKDLFLKKLFLANFINLALYFDNDQPEPRSKSTATNKQYKTTLTSYLAKRAEFEKNYIQGLTGAQKQESTEKMKIFFNADVKGGYDRFNIFLAELLKELERGQRIEINIKGYASPRFDLKYNLVLGQRRVNTVRNEMMAYNNGILKPYFKNNRLIVNQISYGEELAPGDVSDNIKDRSASVYSVAASKQRKVEIISIKAKL